MADLSKIKAHEITLDIVHPKTKQPIGVTVSLRSLDDDELKKVNRRINNERMQLSQRGKFVDAEREEMNNRTVLFAAVTGWHWGKDHDGDDANFHGSKPEFNRVNFDKIADELPWFQLQIQNALLEPERFFPD